jgi:hypothetical protein
MTMKKIVLIDDINRIKEIYKNGEEHGVKSKDNPFDLRSTNKGYNKNFIKSETFFCDLKNEELVNIIKKYITIDDKIEHISSIHHINYSVGDEAKEHTDRKSSIRTYTIMLNDNFKGGDFFILKEQIPFRLCEMIEFDGNMKHSVSKITKGNREVLVIWVNTIKKFEKSLI